MPNQMSSPNEVVVTTTSDYTFPTSGAIPSLLLVDTTSGNITVTLPSPAGLYALYPYDSRQGDVMIMNIGATATRSTSPRRPARCAAKIRSAKCIRRCAICLMASPPGTGWAADRMRLCAITR